MSSYLKTLQFLENLPNFEKTHFVTQDPAGLLGRPRALLARLGDPHRQYPTVLVTGTKGKGSTTAMVASILHAAGYRVGRYTSPHLHTMRERITIDGQLIAREQLIALARDLRPHLEAIAGVTYFEAMTALAMRYFAEQGVDLAVLEIGLGGRLDATNVAEPLVSVITSISYDHMDILGHTLAQIAREKAGIIKARTPVVSAPQTPEALAVIEEVCAGLAAPLTLVGRDWTWARGEANLQGQAFSVAGPGGRVQYPALWMPLLGTHQLDNAATALATIDRLAEQGIAVSPQAVAAGLREVRWPGRFELLNHQPALVVDCAHNGNSALRLHAALDEWFPRPPRRRFALIFGASADKDMDGMLHLFLDPQQTTGYSTIDKLIVSKSGHPRSADPAQLAAMAHAINAACPVSVQADLDDALAEALAWAGPDDLICVTGSIFVVAQARWAWMRRRPEAFAPDDWVFENDTADETAAV